MDKRSLKKWLAPIEEVMAVEIVAYDSLKGWLYGDPFHQMAVESRSCQFSDLSAVTDWTFIRFESESTLILGANRKDPSVDAILKLISLYMRGEHKTYSRAAAFKDMAEGLNTDRVQQAKLIYFHDQGQKFWVWIQTAKETGNQVEKLIRTLGFEDCVAVSEEKVALLLHLKEESLLPEAIDTIRQHIEDDLYVGIKCGVSQPFFDYAQLKTVQASADCALKATELTIESRYWRYAKRDILPMLLANPKETDVVMGAVDKKGALVLLEDGELLHTLACFFMADLNITEAANKLFIHRNTLLYRLSKIEKITGLDPRRLTDAMDLFALVSIVKSSTNHPNY